MPAANAILGLMRAGVPVGDEAAENLRKEGLTKATFTEIEDVGRYRVIKIIRDSKRGLPLIAAIVKSTLGPPIEQKSILVLDRPELPKIEVDSEIWLTAFAFGDCRIYRETLPR